ncbi:MAG: hypothetical protein KGQ37_09400 [Hyphomicrobiales bacterium]|nr:hypothetical protein [Hyphomicrobiales bacterium]
MDFHAMLGDLATVVGRLGKLDYHGIVNDIEAMKARPLEQAAEQIIGVAAGIVPGVSSIEAALHVFDALSVLGVALKLHAPQPVKWTDAAFRLADRGDGVGP